MDLETTIDERGSICLLEVGVHNQSRARRQVRIRNELDAPVIQPAETQSDRVEWDRRGVTIVLEPGERRGLGYACRAPAVEPAASIAQIDPVDDDRGAVSKSQTPQEELRSSDTDRSALDQNPSNVEGKSTPASSTTQTQEPAVRDECESTEQQPLPAEPATGSTLVPPAIDAWLMDVERGLAADHEVNAEALRAVAGRTAALVDELESTASNDK